MATTIPGEVYLGETLVQSLTPSGSVTIYLWPLRCLNNKKGGPTFGIDVEGVEIIRFDPHGKGGHWHTRGYDKLGPGKSHVDFPEGVDDVEQQLEWALGQVEKETSKLLEEAGYPDEANSVDDTMVKSATLAISEHLKKEGDLRPKAIAQGALEA